MRFGKTSAALFTLFCAATPAWALSLSELQTELAKHPEANWRAGQTGALGDLGNGEVPFGLDPNFSAHRVKVSPTAFKTPANLPANIDWRHKDGQNWLPPIRNQGRCGSCVAFAAIGVLEGQYNIAGGVAGFDPDFSEQDLFGRIGRCASGSAPFFALSSLKSTGVPDEVCNPYISGRLGEDASTNRRCSDASQRSVHISGYHSVSASQAKAALQNGPLLTTMDVYEDFMYYTGGVYRHVAGNYEGGHAVVIIGYDDAAGAWIVRNSWGPEWGENGYFRIAYDDESGVGRSNYSVTVSPDSYVKLMTPVHMQAVAGQMGLQAATPRGADNGSVRYSISGENLDGLDREGSFDPTTLKATLDTTALPDGVYELKAMAAESGKTSLPWYETIEVANQPQSVNLQLTPDFNNSQPVTDRVYFKLHVEAGAVPLTAVILKIAKVGGETAVQKYEDPGADSLMGWRTKSFANGEYQIKAIGQIGDLQQFESNALTVSVGN